MKPPTFARGRAHVFDGEAEVFSVPARAFTAVYPPLYSIRWTVHDKATWSRWAERGWHIRQLARVWGMDVGLVFDLPGTPLNTSG
jgi:hypothetical protein